MKLLRDLLLVLLGALIGNALMSPAADFEMMLGKTKFHAREDGIWWQRNQETNNSLVSSSYLLGLKWNASKHVGARFGYTRLGDFSGENWASVRDEDASHHMDATTCNPKTGQDCLALYSGRGHTSGFYLGPFAETKVGPVQLLGEIGVFKFRSRYDVTVLHPYDDVFTPRGNSYEYNHATGDHWTWYLGTQIGYKFFRDASAVLLVRYYKNVYEQGANSCKGGALPGQVCGDVGLTGGWTRQVLAGVSVPF